MSYHFPDLVDPWQLCDQGAEITGRIPLESLPRLAPLLVPAQGEAAFTLLFSRNEHNQRVISSRVDATLAITCQRCLEPMDLPVEEMNMMVPVTGEQEAELLPENMDPLLLDRGATLKIVDLIEDELLLAIPAAPRHTPEECQVDLADFSDEPPVADQDSEKDNPFAILAGLKNSDTDN